MQYDPLTAKFRARPGANIPLMGFDTLQVRPLAGKDLAAIRRIVGTNLLLGLINVAIGTSGRFWP